MAGQAQSRAELQQQAAPPWGELLSFQYFQRLCPPGAGYGYSGGSMQGMRESEFRRLGGLTYLDHAGTALFPQSLLKEFTDDLSKNIYGNPHSQNISSKLTYDTIEHVRYRVSYQNDVELMIRKLAEIDLSAKLSKKREHAQTDVTPTSS